MSASDGLGSMNRLDVFISGGDEFTEERVGGTEGGFVGELFPPVIERTKGKVEGF